MIFHSIFFIKSLTFVLFRSIEMNYWHFMILYHDKWNFSVCCFTISPLGNISKYFAIIKWKVIHQILQILTQNPSHQAWYQKNFLINFICVNNCNVKCLYRKYSFILDNLSSPILQIWPHLKLQLSMSSFLTNPPLMNTFYI